ncbi:alginate O-acetyltransferase AlgX-related protein [Geomonas oryzae]|uniref:alginate O-acetyltransferase AlgX-related protein n=1 Tax=Geomonas oryzae TaxID=2364273 RepID=UPI00100A6181|nr:hypothetical protein [Geomonas oryzae]
MTKTPRIILVIFYLLLLAPLIGQVVRLDPFNDSENRKLSKRPSLEWSFPVLQKFPRMYQAYYNDNFGFRNALVRGNHLLRYGLLGVSPSDQVIIGKKGWLYYTGGGEVDDFRGITRYNEDQLRRWTRALALKRDWLKSQGIRYLLVIAPNKSTIYPEYLPEEYHRLREQSGLDDFMAYVRKHSDVEVVDLRQRLLAEKVKHVLYLRTDTHWNNYGAFVAYSEMIRPIMGWFPAVKPLAFTDFDISLKKTGGGDLAGMIGGREFLSDEDYKFLSKHPLSALRVGETTGPRDPFTMKKGEDTLPRALIFRDSFFTAMVPFVAESFSASHFIWERWNSGTPMEELIAQHKPGIVIEEAVERLTKHDAEVFSAGIPAYLISSSVRKSVTLGKGRELNLSDIKPLYQVVLHHSGKVVTLEATGPDPQLLLPEIIKDHSFSGGMVLRVSISSPVDSFLQLFYKTSQDRTYTEAKSVSVPVRKGSNQVDISLIGVDVAGQLRLDPAGAPGIYNIEKIIAIPCGG